MARIRQDDVEAVRERTDLVRLIQQYVALKRTGQRFAGLCPFHTEKTASFSVEPAKQVYYCFGCGKGGNAYHFLMEVEHLTFPEAVERLAKQAGITLRYEGLSEGDRRTMGRRQALYKANDRAADLYQRTLAEGPEGEDARRYLASRNISEETALAFGLGYAPGNADFLLRRMGRDFSPEILVEAGLARKDAAGHIRDFFRARVTVPVHDLTGRAVGFGARLLQGDGPKYLNTADTPVYDKGSMLYNLHTAKGDVTSSGRAVVVEGYTDVIALHQAGITTAVATCGTALGEGHFRLLSRFAKQAVLAFDSDEAGARAGERAYAFFERYPVEVRVLVLPEGQDPADFVQEHGAEGFEELASAAVPLVEYMIRRSLRGRDFGSPEGQAAAVREALPLVTALQDPVLRSTYAAVLADLVSVSTESVLLELDGASGPRGPAAEVKRAVRAPGREVEREALKLLLQHPELVLIDQLRDEHFTTERHRALLALLRGGEKPAALVERIEDEALARLVAELSVEPLTGPAGNDYVERVSSRLEEFALTREINSMRKRLERLNPLTEPAEYDSLFEELIGLEGRRRIARDSAGEGA